MEFQSPDTLMSIRLEIMALNETSKCDRCERELDLEHFARDL